LTDSQIVDMVIHMKTTLNIADSVMEELRREAARQNRTMSELVEAGLRLLFRSRKSSKGIQRLPTFRSGGTLVDITNRDALDQALESR
jgi:hypothetical protein